MLSLILTVGVSSGHCNKSAHIQWLWAAENTSPDSSGSQKSEVRVLVPGLSVVHAGHSHGGLVELVLLTFQRLEAAHHHGLGSSLPT